MEEYITDPGALIVFIIVFIVIRALLLSDYEGGGDISGGL